MGSTSISIQELENQEEYDLILRLDHQEILPFIQEEFERRNFLIHLYIAINIALVTASIFFGIEQWFAGTMPAWKMLVFLVIGAVLGSTLIVPIHELIHGLVYYMLGAPKVSYGWNLESFYFYAVADRKHG